MPLNPVNFRRQETPDWSSLGNLFENYWKGYEMSQTPERMALEKIYKESQIAKNLRESQTGGLTGRARNIAEVHNYIAQHGEDDPLARKLQAALDLEERREEGILKTQEANINALPTRLLTNEGRAINELLDLKLGYKLGSTTTGNPEKLSASEANWQRAQYELGLMNKVTDASQRDRLRAQADVHTTLSRIDKDAFRGSGIGGALWKKAQQGLSSLTGAESEEYKKLEKNATAQKLLAKQLSRFFGSGAAEGIQKDIEYLANPESLNYSPEIARAKFETLIDIFEAESANQLEAVHNPSFYGAQSPGAYQQQPQTLGGQLYETMTGNQQPAAQDMIKIKNPKTGEIIRVSRAEYEKGQKKK